MWQELGVGKSVKPPSPTEESPQIVPEIRKSIWSNTYLCNLEIQRLILEESAKEVDNDWLPDKAMGESDDFSQ